MSTKRSRNKLVKHQANGLAQGAAPAGSIESASPVIQGDAPASEVAVVSPSAQPLAKREPSQGLSPNDFQLPQSPEINIQQQQREAAQGSQEYAQGVSAAHAIASTQAYQFKQGYADGLNNAMPAVGRDVADYVEGGERAVSNFFRDFTAQIKGH